MIRLYFLINFTIFISSIYPKIEIRALVHHYFQIEKIFLLNQKFKLKTLQKYLILRVQFLLLLDEKNKKSYHL
jgi:hypothetical protein